MKKDKKDIKKKKTESIEIMRIDNGFVLKVLNDDFDTKAEIFFEEIANALEFIEDQF